MRKSILAAAVAAAFVSPMAVSTAFAQAAAPAAAEPASPHTLTGNVGFVSDYRFRSISQTYKQPALQGGFDYSHSSGFYAGTWASNVSSSLYPNGNNMEWDFYGGWKGEVVKDLTLDIGLLYYWYPGSRYFNNVAGGSPTGKYNNTEIYVGATWKWFTLKYNYAVSDYFGLNSATLLGSTFGTVPAGATGFCGTNTSNAATANNGVGAGAPASGTCIPFNNGNSKGSGYLDLTANFDLGSGWGLNGHIGDLRVKSFSAYNYTDYKIGVTKDLGGGFTLGASAISNNAKTAFYQAGPPGTTETKNLRNSTLVVSIIKTF